MALLFIEINQANLTVLCSLRTRINCVKLLSMHIARDPPIRGSYIAGIRNFKGFGAVEPHEGEIWQGRAKQLDREEQTPGPLVTAKFHLDWCNELPLRDENPKNLPVSKNSTGLRPVNSIQPYTDRFGWNRLFSLQRFKVVSSSNSLSLTTRVEARTLTIREQLENMNINSNMKSNQIDRFAIMAPHYQSSGSPNTINLLADIFAS